MCLAFHVTQRRCELVEQRVTLFDAHRVVVSVWERVDERDADPKLHRVFVAVSITICLRDVNAVESCVVAAHPRVVRVSFSVDVRVTVSLAVNIAVAESVRLFNAVAQLQRIGDADAACVAVAVN